MTKLKPQITGK